MVYHAHELHIMSAVFAVSLGVCYDDDEEDADEDFGVAAQRQILLAIVVRLLPRPCLELLRVGAEVVGQVYAPGLGGEVVDEAYIW
jgi:hypothetical protein